MLESCTFKIPEFYRKTCHSDLGLYFPGHTVRVDERFKVYLEGGRRTYSTPELTCAVIMPAPPIVIGSDDLFRFLMRNLPMSEYIGADVVHAMLAYLGTKEGFKHLAIPDGQDEIHLVLGYIRSEENNFVLYVEHELEDGQREIHLHVRPVGQWSEDVPRALLVLDDDC